MRFFYTGNCALLVCAFAAAQSRDCPTACGSGGNAALGLGALDSVTTGINNAAVGTDALTDDTTGSYNVAVGNGALAKQHHWLPKHGHWGGSAQPTATATSTWVLVFERSL